MALASHISAKSKPEGPAVKHGGPLWALLLGLVSLLVPATVWGDIYKWTDENGRTNFSNILPTKSGKASNVELVVKEAKPTAIPDHRATPTEQALLARIENLERQLQAQQIAAPAAPPPAPIGGYYSPPPPPPQPAYYDSGYYSSYYPAYYPAYYPSYNYPIVSSYFYAYPRRVFVGRPVFAVPRSGTFHGGGGHVQFGGGRGGSFHGGGGHFGGGRGGRR